MVETFVPTYEMKFSMLSVILGSSFTLGRYLEAKVHPEVTSTTTISSPPVPTTLSLCLGASLPRSHLLVVFISTCTAR
jgi:hypothetical protein